MFGRRSQAAPAPKELFTYIHAGTLIEGRFEATGRVRVHGTIRGEVVVRGVLEVAETGVVACERLVAEAVRIVGRVEVGRLEASGKVEIWKGGELIGDVRAAALDIEEGAHFTGRSEMSDAASSPAGPGEVLGDALEELIGEA